MEKNCCQKVTDDGMQECAFLLGNRCVYDRNNPMQINVQFHRMLKVVGCQSWSRYMEWNHGENTMSRLPVNPVGKNRGDSSQPVQTGKGSGVADASPVSALQEGHINSRGNPDDGRPSEDYMRLRCFICGQPAVALSVTGIYHCAEHHEKFKAGKSDATMMKEHEAKL